MVLYSSSFETWTRNQDDFAVGSYAYPPSSLILKNQDIFYCCSNVHAPSRLRKKTKTTALAGSYAYPPPRLTLSSHFDQEIKTTLLVVLLFTLSPDSDQETQTFPWLWFLHLACFHNKIKKINTIGMWFWHSSFFHNYILKNQMTLLIVLILILLSTIYNLQSGKGN